MTHFNKRLFASGVLICFLFIFSLSSFAQSANEAKKMAQTALMKGDYSTAIQNLQLIIEYLGNSKKEGTQRSLEGVYFKIGLCHFLLGNFTESDKAFKLFLDKYPKSAFAAEAQIYIADGLRFRGKFKETYKIYERALKKYHFKYNNDMQADIYCSMIRCKIAKNKWADIVPLVKKVFKLAPDLERRNWAASMCTIAYLKDMELSKLYHLVPLLMKKDSFASRSVALNIALLEAGDDLFGEEMFREALWLYRLVYSKKELAVNMRSYLRRLKRESNRLKQRTGSLRALMRIQERIGETEAEIQALQGIQDYDKEMFVRMAKSYMEINRFREACTLYLYIHDNNSGELADESLFLAFRCALNLRPLSKAFSIGEQYMTEYPKGIYFDDLSLAIANVYALLQDWPKLTAHLKKTLKIKPDHADQAEIHFLIAYASFMMEDFKETVYWLTKLNKEHPDNPRLKDALYWLGMAKMFMKEYEGAAVDFDELLKKFYGSMYTEDARYRRAVCSYGLSEWADAQKRLETYVKAYPKGNLTGEAYMMLGDIYAQKGGHKNLLKAIHNFQKVADYKINIELYNYSMFRCAKIMFENQLKFDGKSKKWVIDYNGVIEHFNRYLEADRPGSNIPQAIFYIGRSLWQLDKKSEAMDKYLAAIKKYGNDVKALGVDMILEEWISKANSLRDKSLKERTWKDLQYCIKQAKQQKNKVMELRLKRALCYRKDERDVVKQNIMKEIVKEENIPYAGPSTLELIMDEALKRGDKKLAMKAAETIVSTFTETDSALGARLFIAKEAAAKKDYKKALRHLGVIREVFATQEMAGEALAMIGEIYIDQKKFSEADECFKTITEVKSWKKLWPRALIGRGECAEGERDPRKASAYYERIYVMYGNYKKWVSIAYLKRAKCLKELREYQKAYETLKEMLGLEELSKYPEWKTAEREFRSLEARL